MIRALLWDVDGTLAETERDGHLVAFNRAFEAAGVPWRWSAADYGRLLEVAGGYERLLHDLQHRDEAPRGSASREGLARQLHQLKNGFYEDIVRAGELPLRAGVPELLAECAAAGVPMAIVTTTTSSNVAALLERHLGRDWRRRFAAVVTAAEAPRKKPDPQVYELALAALGVAAREAAAIEDAPAGVEACRRAGVPVIVAHSHYFPGTAAGARAAGPSLGSGAGWRPAPAVPGARIGLEQIRRWCT
ncbi:MAG TPA: HAD-IA family hydrolase [Steroidobacteraceae bacterium]|nr:HAD-IA family hydrolase [Steroidobacteraceae bacterium]